MIADRGDDGALLDLLDGSSTPEGLREPSSLDCALEEGADCGFNFPTGLASSALVSLDANSAHDGSPAPLCSDGTGPIADGHARGLALAAGTGPIRTPELPFELDPDAPAALDAATGVVEPVEVPAPGGGFEPPPQDESPLELDDSLTAMVRQEVEEGGGEEPGAASLLEAADEDAAEAGPPEAIPPDPGTVRLTFRGAAAAPPTAVEIPPHLRRHQQCACTLHHPGLGSGIRRALRAVLAAVARLLRALRPA